MSDAWPEHLSLAPELEGLGRSIVDAGLEVHRALGPGLLESAYEQCLAHELRERGLAVNTQVSHPLTYKGLSLEAGYRLDMVVEECVVVEVKAAEATSRLHEAQLRTYLRLTGYRLGFLMNFNVPLFKEGLRRLVVDR